MPSSREGGKVLFIDAYDSFSENIAAMLSQILSVEVTMIHIDTRIDSLVDIPSTSTLDKLAVFLHDFDAVVLGPGPGNPNNARDIGLFSYIWELRHEDIVPVLGICLGFQSLCVTHGASISRLPEPCHGHAKKIHHCGEDLFANAGHVLATNYNSLEVKLAGPDATHLTDHTITPPVFSSSSERNAWSSPSTSQSKPRHSLSYEPFPSSSQLRPLAWDDFGTLMAVRHVELPYWGLQFHPESCKSSASCQQIIKNWWQASTRWYNQSRLTTAKSSRLLPAGHVWSRPLTPISAPAYSCEFPEHHIARSTLYEHLLALTTSSGGSVRTRLCRLSTKPSAIAELCKNLSPDTCAMLESTRKGRYSIYAFPSPGRCRLEYSLQTSICTVYSADQSKMEFKMTLEHLLDHVHTMVADKRAERGRDLLPFWGGFIGFFSYEVGLENISVQPSCRQACADFPDVSLLWVERSIVIDHFENNAYIQSLCLDDAMWVSEMTQKLGSMPDGLSSPGTSFSELQTALESAEIVLPDQDSYKRKIRSCQSYLHAGDSYELCLTAETHITMPSRPENPWLLYQSISRQNPVPYSAFLCLGKTTILSSSPERFLAWDRSTGAIDMVPMKGTVTKSPTMTLERAREILASPKESAENLMIADLIRHDLYSIVGWDASVEVIKLCEVVEHETVYQLVSHIKATPMIAGKESSSRSSSSSPSPCPSTTSVASASASFSKSVAPSNDRHRQVTYYGHKALKQTLPPGSMTGAPKKRSCEILDRLEERRRGPYSGAIGYLDVGGGGGFSVCIRTAVSHTDDDEDCGDPSNHDDKRTENGDRATDPPPQQQQQQQQQHQQHQQQDSKYKKQKWRIGAGGAITVLSDPEAEWEEMRTKLDSVLRAFRPDRQL